MKLLDLFSGIGGFSYVFHGSHTTVAYCEIDHVCKDILKSNMDKEFIDTAPIYDDIRTIIPFVSKLKPQMITAGFPCQDISFANMKGEGIRGTKSSLYKHILNILDNVPSIQVVFMENSPNILNKGYEQLEADFICRGYNIKYAVIAASDVGAPHRRKRWYAIAFRPGVDLHNMVLHDFVHHDWSREPVKRVLKKDKSKNTAYNKRCERLGNSIVPHAAVFAWNVLCSGDSQTPQCKPWKPKLLRLLDPVYHTALYFPTPTFTYWGMYTRPYPRGTRCIGNFIYWEQDTYDQARRWCEQDRFHIHTCVSINPRFIEWLMGYPRDYTRSGKEPPP